MRSFKRKAPTNKPQAGMPQSECIMPSANPQQASLNIRDSIPEPLVKVEMNQSLPQGSALPRESYMHLTPPCDMQQAAAYMGPSQQGFPPQQSIQQTIAQVPRTIVPASEQPLYQQPNIPVSSNTPIYGDASGSVAIQMQMQPRAVSDTRFVPQGNLRVQPSSQPPPLDRRDGRQYSRELASLTISAQSRRNDMFKRMFELVKTRIDDKATQCIIPDSLVYQILLSGGASFRNVDLDEQRALTRVVGLSCQHLLYSILDKATELSDRTTVTADNVFDALTTMGINFFFP